MNESYISNAKYTCRGCMKMSEDLFTMTAEDLTSYRKYVKVDSSNTIMKICFICKYTFRKFTKFILQCQKINEIINNSVILNNDNRLEEEQTFHLEKFNLVHNFMCTKPVTHYHGPDCNGTKDDGAVKYEELYEKDEINEEMSLDVNGCDDVCDDGDDIPLVMLKDIKEETDVKVKKRRKNVKKYSDRQINQVKEKERRSKVKKQLKEGFSSRMVQETNEYEVIKLTKEQVLQEMEEKRKTDKYLRSVYKCEKCAKGFNFKDVIDNHMKKHSQEQGILKCEICTQYCPSAVSLRGHMKSHTTRYKCKICGAVRISRQHLLEHYSIEHTFDASDYTCDQCPFTTKKRTVIQRHVKSHKTGKSLTCSVCDASFNNMHTLRMHASRHDPTQRFSCSQCNMKFIYPSLLYRHARIHSHRDHYCVECDVTFKSIDNLKLHFKRAKRHRDPSTYKYKCSQCEERFISPSSVLAHLSAAHGAAKTHACALCGKLYSSRESVKSHERRAHRTSEASVRCDTCHKEFTRKYVLAKHLRTHSDAHGCCGAFTQHSIKHKKQESNEMPDESRET